MSADSWRIRHKLRRSQTAATVGFQQSKMFLPFEANPASEKRRHVEVFAIVKRWLAPVEAATCYTFERQRLLFRLGRLLLPGGFRFNGRSRRRPRWHGWAC